MLGFGKWNVYKSPLTGLPMYVRDAADPCEGGRKHDEMGRIRAMMQATYWGQLQYRLNVKPKVVLSDADYYVHTYFEDVKRRLVSEGRLR